MVSFFDEILELGRRVNVNSLRLISLGLLFLSLTPLASLYVVFSSAWNSLYNGARQDGDTSFSPDFYIDMEDTNLLTVLRDPNSTLEEILAVILLERAHTIGGTVPTMAAYHWAAVVPWCLSMLFGFVIPILLYLMSCIRSWRMQQMRASDYAAYRIKRRRERLQSYLSKYTKVC